MRTASSSTTICANSCRRSPRRWLTRRRCAKPSLRRRAASGTDSLVAEDWRLTAKVDAHGLSQLLDRLREREVEGEARKRLGSAVAVSADGETLFAYTDSREAIHQAADLIRTLLAERGLEADVAVHRWHELEQRWEDEGVPLPRTEAERHAEHERLAAA